MPLFFPSPEYVPRIEAHTPFTTEALCTLAGVACKASGPWTQRRVGIVTGDGLRIWVAVTPGREVLIQATQRTPQAMARFALGALAYSVFDLVARQSIAGQPWSRVAPPPGRPKSRSAKSNAERQRQWRVKHKRRAAGLLG